MAGFAVDDAAPDVERDFAAALENFSKLLATALNTRLRTGQRDPKHFRGLALRSPLKLRERQRFPVRRRQLSDCAGGKRGEAGIRRGRGLVVELRLLLVLACQRVPSTLTEVLLHGAVRDLIKPRNESLLIAEPGQPLLHANENVLEHVVHVGRGHAPRNERPELLRDLSMRSQRAFCEHYEGSPSR